ncbi:MAG: hypothetical protein ABSG19_01495 [Candidatus Aminicenantales bacterium]
MNNVFRSKVLIVGLVAAFMLLVAPVREFAQAKAPVAAAGGSLVGFVYAKDMKTPVANAVVKIRDVSNPKEFASRPTDVNGMYKITGLPEGRYILGVTTAAGNFNFDYALILKGSEMAKLSVALAPGGRTSGNDAAAKSFFSSPENIVGVVIFVVAIGTLSYLAFHKPEEASPIR